MDLVEITQRLTAAIEVEHFAAIAKALEDRAAAIAEFGASIPSPASIAHCELALKAGEAACRLLQSIKQRTVSDSARLTQIQEGFVENLRRTHLSRIDYRG